eukprot:scaffold5447_cov430-Prasinococcus_capsulatus_cf.AAC.5
MGAGLGGGAQERYRMGSLCTTAEAAIAVNQEIGGRYHSGHMHCCDVQPGGAAASTNIGRAAVEGGQHRRPARARLWLPVSARAPSCVPVTARPS